MSKVEILAKIEPLRPSRFALGEHAFNTYNALVVEGVTLQDILDSKNYFAHVSRKLRVGDEVRLLAEDGTWIARLYVRHADGSDIRVHPIDHVSFEDKIEPTDVHEGYRIDLCGPKKFCIRNADDGSIIKEGIPTRVEAQRELNDLITALAR